METIMTELERCKAEYDEADFAEREILRNRRAEECEYMRVARETITKELEEKYGNELRELAAKRQAVQAAYDAAIVADTIANLMYPVGTKLIGWMKPNIRYRQRDAKYAQVAAGILEIVGPDTKFAENLEYRPGVGKVIVRLLKKDGTPSVKYDSYRNGKHKWLPEGEKPKDI